MFYLLFRKISNNYFQFSHSDITAVKLYPDLSDIQDISKKQRLEIVLNAIGFKLFESGSTMGGGIKILDEGLPDKKMMMLS